MRDLYNRGLSALDVLGADMDMWTTESVVLGAVIDVDGLIDRMDSMQHTNDNAKHVWGLHGFQLADRVAAAAQDMLNKAVVPTGEFAWHDQMLAFAARANVLGTKLSPLPFDDKTCPYWDDLTSYMIDGSKLANAMEGVVADSVKWDDVKAAAAQAAAGAKHLADKAETAAKWTIGLAIGGVALILFGVYKIASGPTGQVAARTLLR